MVGNFGFFHSHISSGPPPTGGEVVIGRGIQRGSRASKGSRTTSLPHGLLLRVLAPFVRGWTATWAATTKHGQRPVLPYRARAGVSGALYPQDALPATGRRTRFSPPGQLNAISSNCHAISENPDEESAWTAGGCPLWWVGLEHAPGPPWRREARRRRGAFEGIAEASICLRAQASSANGSKLDNSRQT